MNYVDILQLQGGIIKAGTEILPFIRFERQIQVVYAHFIKLAPQFESSSKILIGMNVISKAFLTYMAYLLNVKIYYGVDIQQYVDITSSLEENPDLFKIEFEYNHELFPEGWLEPYKTHSSIEIIKNKYPNSAQLQDEQETKKPRCLFGKSKSFGSL